MMRLNRYLAKCGVASRRKADDLILGGRVKVNGVVTDRLGSQVNEKSDRVELDNEIVLPSGKTLYLLLNKPPGYITTVKDPFKRPTVMDLIPKTASVTPVGRLDLDTEGVLLLSNDGDLNYRLTHPRYQIEKRYQVRIDRKLKSSDLKTIMQGVDIGISRKVRADNVALLSPDTLEMSLHEGLNRQVKRMLGSLGYSVLSLKRIRFGFLHCDDLEAGSWRYLSPDEVYDLKQAVQLNANGT